MTSSPDDRRLLQGVRKAVSALAERATGPEVQQIIGSANALLNELELRVDVGFYGEHLARGLEILRGLPQPLLEQVPAVEREQAMRVLPMGAGYTEVASRIDAVMKCFESVASACAAHEVSRHSSLLSGIIAWEAEPAIRTAQFKPDVPASDSAITPERLLEYLRQRFPARPGLRIRDFRALVGGLQKLTILFDLEDDVHGRESLVLRGEQPDRFLMFDLGLIPDEYRMVRLAFAAGLPVAEPLWLEADPAHLGRRFIVSRKVPGINFGHATGVFEIPRAVARALTVALARLHAIPVMEHIEEIRRTPLAHWLEHTSLADNTRANMEYWRTLPRESDYGPSAALAALRAWLVANVPEEEGSVCFVHSDYGPHNILVDAETVTGILDWESTRIGDPAEDVAYFLAGMERYLPREEILSWYREAGGPPISSRRLHYFDVFNIMKVLGSCVAARAIYAHDPSARNEWTPLAFQYAHYPLGLIDKILLR